MPIDSKKPTALLLGRFQGFHEGHKALVLEALSRAGQVCIAVRDTQGTDERNPMGFDEIAHEIAAKLGPQVMERVRVILLPNITHVFYGRDVGYAIERIGLSPELESLSATKVREGR